MAIIVLLERGCYHMATVLKRPEVQQGHPGTCQHSQRCQAERHEVCERQLGRQLAGRLLHGLMQLQDHGARRQQPPHDKRHRDHLGYIECCWSAGRRSHPEQAQTWRCDVVSCNLCSNCVCGSMRLWIHLLNLTREAALLTGTVLPLAAFSR